MKVLLVANTEWYLYNFRLSLARYLRDRGHEVVLVSPSGPYAPRLQSAGFRWLAWEVGRRTVNPLQEVDALNRLTRIYRAERPDLVHHFTVKPVQYGSLAAQRVGVPAVVNAITGLGYVFLEDRFPGRLLRPVVLGLYWLAFRHPNYAVIFENETDRDTFYSLRLVRPERARVIQGVGVDVDRFCPQPEPDEPLVVFPSRMLLDKGLGVLVEAARLLRERRMVRIALVGEPDPGNPATVTEADLCGWEAEGLVEWWGFREDMAAVFAGCQVVTLPSMGEGLPTALIEAAACGRPIVTTNVPGCRDVVQDGVNGLLVAPNQPQALAEAIERLLDDPDLRQRFGQASRQIALERFRNQVINERTLAVYQSVLERVTGR